MTVSGGIKTSNNDYINIKLIIEPLTKYISLMSKRSAVLQSDSNRINTFAELVARSHAKIQREKSMESRLSPTTPYEIRVLGDGKYELCIAPRVISIKTERGYKDSYREHKQIIIPYLPAELWGG